MALSRIRSCLKNAIVTSTGIFIDQYPSFFK